MTTLPSHESTIRYRVSGSGVLALAILLCAVEPLPAVAKVPVATIGESYTITGGDMSGYWNHVNVYGSEGAVLDAVVTLNGTVLPMSSTSGRYSGHLPSLLSPGEALTLEIQIGTDVITATDVVPERPTVTGPSESEEFGPESLIPVSWSSSEDPDRFTVFACWAGCSTGATWSTAGTERNLYVPASGLPVDEPVEIMVFAYRDGDFTGPVDEASKMSIRGEGLNQPEIYVRNPLPTVATTWGGLKTRY